VRDNLRWPAVVEIRLRCRLSPPPTLELSVIHLLLVYLQFRDRFALSFKLRFNAVFGENLLPLEDVFRQKCKGLHMWPLDEGTVRPTVRRTVRCPPLCPSMSPFFCPPDRTPDTSTDCPPDKGRGYQKSRELIT
jgi:hypothetical protein